MKYKVAIYQKRFPDKIVLPAILSLGGFTDKARQFCQAQGVGEVASHRMFVKYTPNKSERNSNYLASERKNQANAPTY